MDDTGINLTGRDRYIVWQALVYAIAAIDSLPEEQREYSNQEDMRLILAERYPLSTKDPASMMIAQRIRKRFGLPPVVEV